MLKTLPRDVPEMDSLDFTTLMMVKEMAAGMNKEEILNTFSLTLEDLDEDEIIYFNEFYNYGRGTAVNTVIQNLLQQSKGKGGQAAAMAFLRRFSKEFEAELEGDSKGSFSFSFGGDESA